MTLKDLSNIINNYSLKQSAVSEYKEGDIYENLNNGEHKYGFVNFTINSIQRTEQTNTVNCYLFYVDRLTEDNGNKLDIWSVGTTVLQRILSEVTYNAGTFFEIGEVTTYTTFTEKFNDLCAGVYATLEITVLNEVDECFDYIPTPTPVPEGTITITENGTYDVTDFAEAVINIPQEGQEEIDRLTAEVNRLSAVLENAMSQIDADTELIAELQSQIDELNEQIQKLTQEASEKDERISELERELSVVYSEKTALEKEIEVLNRTIGYLQDRIDSITTKTITLNGTYEPDDNVAGWNRVIVDVPADDERIRELEAELERVREDKAELKKQVNTLNEYISELERRIRDLNVEIDSLKEERRQLREQIATLEGEKTALQNEVNDKAAQITALNEQINNLVSTVESQAEEIRVLAASKAQTEAELAEAQRRILELEDENSQLQEEIENLTQEATELNRQISLLTDRINVLESEKTALETRLSTIGSKTITQNGKYLPQSGIEGWNEIIVDVPSAPSITYQIMTQAAYNALTTKDNNVIYIIND